MKMRKINPIHPGKIVLEELLLENNITTEQLAAAIEMPVVEVDKFLIEHHNFTPDFISLLATYFNISVDFFYNLQKDYEIRLLNSNSNFQEKKLRIKPFISNYSSNMRRELRL